MSTSLLTRAFTGQAAAGRPGVAQATRKRILVVDDDPNVLAALGRLLLRVDVDAATCADPETAIKLFSEQSFDLVISDERMPKMSGLDMLGRVRAASPATPTILLTAYSDERSQCRAYERCGVYRFVTKPWNNFELIATIRDALRAAETIR